jgi:hypothetical protein
MTINPLERPDLFFEDGVNERKMKRNDGTPAIRGIVWEPVKQA